MFSLRKRNNNFARKHIKLEFRPSPSKLSRECLFIILS